MPLCTRAALSSGHEAERAWTRAAIIGTASAVFMGIGFVLPSHAGPPPPKVSFQKDVLPIFEARCVSCHSPGGIGYISSSMDLRNYQGLKMGSIGGIAVIPYHPDRSPLMRYLSDNWHSDDKNALKMPPLGPELSPKDLGIISEWIEEGAKDN